MRPSAIVLASMAGIVAVAQSALADPAGLPKDFMRVYGLAQPPYGFVEFCKRLPRECLPGPPEQERFDASPERLAELDAVNRTVNHEIEPITDLELYGEEKNYYLYVHDGRDDHREIIKTIRENLVDNDFIILLHIQEDPEQDKEDLRDEIYNVKRTRYDLDEMNIRSYAFFRKGNRLQQILKMAKRYHCKLIITPERPAVDKESYRMSDLNNNIVKNSPIPVLLIKTD